MDLRQLRHFVAVAATRNVRRAADQLHMTQPPLSTSLRKLEAELGVTLFERTPREMRLTPEGNVLLDHARRVLAEADNAVRTMRDVRSGHGGSLAIGFVGSASDMILPMLVSTFRASAPGVRLELRESTTVQILPAVENGDCDFGIVRTPLLAESPLHLDPLVTTPLIVALPTGHRLTRRDGIRLADLQDEPMVGYSRDAVPILHAAVALACEAGGFRPRFSQEAIQLQTILGLVAGGLGIALVPSSTARHVRSGLIFRTIEDGGVGSTTLALVHADRLTPAGTRLREAALSLCTTWAAEAERRPVPV